MLNRHEAAEMRGFRRAVAGKRLARPKLRPIDLRRFGHAKPLTIGPRLALPAGIRRPDIANRREAQAAIVEIPAALPARRRLRLQLGPVVTTPGRPRGANDVVRRGLNRGRSSADESQRDHAGRLHDRIIS